jgi:hypothetical protein
VRVVVVPDSSVGFSDVIGGVLLDEPFAWVTPVGEWVHVYLGEGRTGAVDNRRLSIIMTRLGLTDRAFHEGAKGDALLLGANEAGADANIPTGVLVALTRCGIPIAGVSIEINNPSPTSPTART